MFIDRSPPYLLLISELPSSLIDANNEPVVERVTSEENETVIY